LNAPRTSLLSTLSLHDALPISGEHSGHRGGVAAVLDPVLEVERGVEQAARGAELLRQRQQRVVAVLQGLDHGVPHAAQQGPEVTDRKSTRLNSSHEWISYAVFC